jgi:membrane protein DedA with SNARE-associated domain
MEIVLTWLLEYEYVAMIGILMLCGVGLPLPEEVTLLGSGLLVGWHEADFWLSTLACSLGILAGDSIIFGLGHHYGQRFLQSRPMHLLLPPHRQARVQAFFENHGSKALFLARFFPGVRIGVYAYAGSQRISWARFVTLDGLGVLISGPTSILVGRWAAQAFANDRDEAIRVATAQMHRFGPWLVTSVVLLVMGLIGLQAVLRRLARRH